MTQQFQAICYFLTQSSFDRRWLENDHEIHFIAENPEEATRAVWRWIQDRIRNVPSHFGKPACIKLYHFNPKPISQDGKLEQAHFLPFYEWKADWIGQSMPEELERLGMATTDYPRRAPRMDADAGE